METKFSDLAPGEIFAVSADVDPSLSPFMKTCSITRLNTRFSGNCIQLDSGHIWKMDEDTPTYEVSHDQTYAPSGGDYSPTNPRDLSIYIP